jgi:NAD(P)-dependent dehydrogenase (short-subunit alcohol dehydrogenase family)
MRRRANVGMRALYASRGREGLTRARGRRLTRARPGSRLAVPVAIVTGSNSGIGRASAVALARSGFDVGITWHREEERARDAVREIEGFGRRCALRHLDLERAERGPEAVEALAQELGGVDALVNNAGHGTTTPVLEMSLDAWRSVLETNLTGAFLCAQTAARRMTAAGRGGAIVNVTSVHEHIPLSGSAPYTASKHGLGGLTKVMALELGEHGIRVNAVAPGQIATRMTGQEDEAPDTIDVPLGRAGNAHEVGALVAWLCSQDASYVTGASYVVDGGLSLIAAEHQ